MNLPEPDYNHAPLDSAQTSADKQLGFNSAKQLTKLDQLSPLALAYIGDAVFELYVRTQLLMPPKRMASYHSRVVSQVRAESQAIHLAAMLPYLDDQEKDMLRKGRNACVNKPKRLSRHIYQQATGFEVLVGYLHLTDPQRLQALLTELDLEADV